MVSDREGKESRQVLGMSTWWKGYMYIHIGMKIILGERMAGT